MPRLTLYGIPEHVVDKLREMTDAPLWLIGWRILAVALFIAVMVVVFGATGGSGVAAIFVAFVFTTLLSQLLADDALAVWRNIWNAQWGEVKV